MAPKAQANKTKRMKKKVVDSFLKKEWYEVRAPAVFEKRDIAKTLVNRTTGNKLAADSLRGRVFEISQGDLTKEAESDAFRVFKFRVEDIQGKMCLTNFYGMRLTTDKIRSICRKWHSLIEAHVDVKTAEGYVLRVFAIAFTKRMPNQNRKTTYAKSSQIKAIRKQMVDILEKEITGKDLNSLITRLISQSIGKEIEKVCHSTFPLQNAFVRKIKVLRVPKTDMSKLLEMHGGATSIADAQKAYDDMVVDRDDSEEIEGVEAADVDIEVNDD